MDEKKKTTMSVPEMRRMLGLGKPILTGWYIGSALKRSLSQARCEL